LIAWKTYLIHGAIVLHFSSALRRGKKERSLRVERKEEKCGRVQLGPALGNGVN